MSGTEVFPQRLQGPDGVLGLEGEDNYLGNPEDLLGGGGGVDAEPFSEKLEALAAGVLSDDGLGAGQVTGQERAAEGFGHVARPQEADGV